MRAGALVTRPVGNVKIARSDLQTRRKVRFGLRRVFLLFFAAEKYDGMICKRLSDTKMEHMRVKLCERKWICKLTVKKSI